MKTTVTKFIVGMMLVQNVAYVSPAFAQSPDAIAGQIAAAKAEPKAVDKRPSNLPETSVLPILGGRGQGNTLIGGPGGYNFQNISIDINGMMKDVYARTNQIQDQDKAYLENIMKQMREHMSDLVKLDRRLAELSQRSQLEGGDKRVGIQEYLNLINEIKQKNNSILADIEGQAFISRESLPSYDAAKVGDISATVNTPGKIDFTPVMGRVEAYRRKMIEGTNNQQFPNIFAKGNQMVKVTKDALNPSLQGISILDASEIQAKQKEMNDLLVPNRSTQQLLQTSVEVIVNNIQTLVDQLGTKQFLTWETVVTDLVGGDNSHKETLKEAVQKINNAFFQRSYLRKRFGQRLGTFNVEEYKVGLLRTDKYLKQPINYVATMFKNQVVIEENDITTAFNNARLWFHTLDAKGGNVLGSTEDLLKAEGKEDKYSAKDASLGGVFMRFNSLITKASGQQEVNEVMRMVVRLLLADIREEQLLVAQDKEGLDKFHDLRFRATAEARELTNKKMCQMDFTLPEDLYKGEGNCVKLGVKVKPTQPRQIGRTQAGVYIDILAQIQGPEKARSQEATNIKKLITAALEAQISPEEKAQELEQANDLFK